MPNRQFVASKLHLEPLCNSRLKVSFVGCISSPPRQQRSSKQIGPACHVGERPRGTFNTLNLKGISQVRSDSILCTAMLLPSARQSPIPYSTFSYTCACFLQPAWVTSFHKLSWFLFCLNQPSTRRQGPCLHRTVDPTNCLSCMH